MKRQWVGVITTLLILAAAAVWIAEAYHARTVEDHKRLALGELSTLRAGLDGQLTSSLVVVKAFQAEVLLNPEFTQQRFERLADALIDPGLTIRHIAIAPDLVVEYVYPLAGNEPVLGFDYRTNEQQFATVQKAVQQNKIIITGPVDLVQGGQALIARAAVKTATGDNWGVIAAVISIEDLLESVGFNSHSSYQFGLKSIEQSTQQASFIAGSKALWENPVTMSMAVPGYQWQLAVRPRATEGWAQRSTGYYIVVATGLLMVTLIGLFLISIVRTQHRLQQAMAYIDHQARYDDVSELPNRNSFIEHLQRLTQQRTAFATLFIDLDHFKEVNDTLGHDVGDKLLAVVASRLCDNLRAEDFVARLGGDEFVIVLYGTSDRDIIGQLAGDINNVLSTPFTVEQNRVQISSSIGIALFPEDGLNYEDLLKHADLAMYAAKSSGRRTYHFFNQELQRITEHNKALKSQIRTALEEQQLRVFYQPVINIDSGQVVKCEALVRWWQDDHWVPPDEFIPIAENSGLIEEIGDYVFTQVCQDWLQFKQHGLALTVAINRSEQELYDLDKAKRWVDELRSLDIPTDKVIFEITETLLMSGKQQQLAVLDLLREAGIRIALDDFGTGYSSISYLQKYAVDLIKIDRQFLHKAPNDQVQVALVTALTRVAQALNIKIVAEGIENYQQLRMLQRIDCDFGQGFYVSPALPADQFIEFVKDWEAGR